MNSRDALVFAAVAGLVAGCKSSSGLESEPATPAEKPAIEGTAEGKAAEGKAAEGKVAEGKASAPQPKAEPAAGSSNCCKGMNACKGKGACAVHGANDCAGNNACKGKGGCKPSGC